MDPQPLSNYGSTTRNIITTRLIIMDPQVVIFSWIQKSSHNHGSMKCVSSINSPVVQLVAYRTREQEVAGLLPGRGQHSSGGLSDSHCDRIHSPLTVVHCFHDGCVGKHQWLGKNIVQSTCR